MASSSAALSLAGSASGSFPRFEDGDVLILLSPTRQYSLHSRTLSLHSSWFKDHLLEETAAQLASKFKRDRGAIRWRFDLQLPEARGGVGRLVPQELNDRGGLKHAPTTLGLEGGKLQSPLYQHYDNMFRALYYQPVNIDDKSINGVLHDILGLADVAEMLGSMQVVGLQLDNALIKQGQMLYRSIASSAVAWAVLACRIRSELIFKEALIHLVGQWPQLEDEERRGASKLSELQPDIMAVCARKIRELDQLRQAIDMRILGHYPTHMHRPTNQNVGAGSMTIRGTGKSTRASVYAQDNFAWMALALYRQWVGQHIAGGMSQHSMDGGYHFYRALASGGDVYMDHGAVESFTRYFPLSAKARNSFLSQLSLIKEGVRPYVVALVENKSMLDITRWPVKYLTCTDVKNKDYPWNTAVAGNPRARARDESVVSAPIAPQAAMRTPTSVPVRQKATTGTGSSTVIKQSPQTPLAKSLVTDANDQDNPMPDDDGDADAEGEMDVDGVDKPGDGELDDAWLDKDGAENGEGTEEAADGEAEEGDAMDDAAEV